MVRWSGDVPDAAVPGDRPRQPGAAEPVVGAVEAEDVEGPKTSRVHIRRRISTVSARRAMPSADGTRARPYASYPVIAGAGSRPWSTGSAVSSSTPGPGSRGCPRRRSPSLVDGLEDHGPVT
ncbi:hypothetical protein AQJ64_03170 [Streptomyces griseoruber]|uniref:Uncharacterized protein n=1 Tax=Streptomyces griseoruber TaxID=1943 RepID=A0A101T9R7_9ACTN|nr:hypothetical protein AQJ64_03170 [Streptomyces griseoruber]